MGILVAFCALILDALLGEPKWLWSKLPHPAVIMGKCVSWLDNALNTGAQKRIKGIVTLIILVLAGWAIGGVLSWFGFIAEILVLAILLAHRSLVDHVTAVADGLRLSLGDGRLMVAQIVGRETAKMDEAAVARGAIESAAENLSDGVIAPLFWFLVAGLPGVVIYKFVNTADSMIGYRNERYAEFGWAAARFDDLLNMIPARLTALLIALVRVLWPQLADIRAEAVTHLSPNAGWPEAAVAIAQDIALSGPRYYDGTLRPEAFVNDDGRHDIDASDIDDTVEILWHVWGSVVGLCGLVVLLGIIF